MDTIERRAAQAHKALGYYFWTAGVIRGTIPEEMIKRMEERKKARVLGLEK